MSRWKEQKEAEERKKQAQHQKEKPTLEEIEDGTLSEFDTLHEGFRERAAKENQRFYDVTNTDYYFVVCFSNNAQLVEFCESVGLNPDEIYMDGRQFAKKINRALKTPDTQFPKTQAFNRDFMERAVKKQRQ